MKLKFILKEDVDTENIPDSLDDPNVEIQYTEDEDGNVGFRFWNGKEYIDVDDNSPQYYKLLDELEEQKRIEELKEEDPDFDPDKWREEDQERIDAINARKVSDQILADTRDKKRDDVTTVAADTRMIRPRMIKNPTLSELEEVLEEDFQNMVLTPIEIEAEEVYHYYEHDPESSADERIMDDWTSRKEVYIEDYIEEHKPVVYIFIDRSGSWGKYDYYTHEVTNKFRLSQTIVDTFFQFHNEGRALVKVFYFGNRCASEDDICAEMGLDPEELNELEGNEMAYRDDNGNRAYVGGGTAINPVVEALLPFKDKELNVVVLTDADTEGNYVPEKVHINGAVWYIFAENWSKDLQDQITGDFQRRFYYTTSDMIRDDD